MLKREKIRAWARISHFVFLSVVFKWHRGSESVNAETTPCVVQRLLSLRKRFRTMWKTIGVFLRVVWNAALGLVFARSHPGVFCTLYTSHVQIIPRCACNTENRAVFLRVIREIQTHPRKSFWRFILRYKRPEKASRAISIGSEWNNFIDTQKCWL